MIKPKIIVKSTTAVPSLNKLSPSSIVIATRAMVVYPCVWLRNRLIKEDQIPSNWTHILFWGGLKGSLSIALIVGLPESFPLRHLFLTVGFGVVLFTLIVQAITMRPLVRRLEI